MGSGAVPLVEYEELLACYRRLGAAPESSEAALKTRYRQLAKRWHPDKHARTPRDVARAEATMKAINVAYRRIKHAPLAGLARSKPPQPRRPSPGTGTGTTARRVDWDWGGLARAKGFPDGPWVTQCVRCKRSVTATGIRYVECGQCGKGFFPDVEDPRAEPPQPLSWQQKLAIAIASALFGAIHLGSVAPRASPGEYAEVLVVSFLLIGLPLALDRERKDR